MIAMAPTGAGAQTANPLLSFAPFLMIIIIFYFFLIRPQAKRQKEHRLMLEELKKGDRVVTSACMLGIVAGIKEKEGTVLLEVDKNVKIEVTKASVAQVLKVKTE